MRHRLSSRLGKLALVISFVTVGLGFAEAQTITTLDPPSIAAKYPFPTLTLQVNGSGFESGAVVQWNGSPLATTFAIAMQVTATVPNTLYQTPGTATVTVLSGGATSSSATFTINPPNPAITSTSPSSAIAGGAGFTLTINGTGFVAGATVQLGNLNLVTTFISSSQVTAFVPASVISSPATPLVTVINPDGNNAGLDTFPFIRRV
ncbi:MAG: IPT/TIG domain-containing protein [Bryobacteraceae bacterium]